MRTGDEVAYFLTPQQEQKPAFCVLYEDDNVVAVDKESGVNSEAVFAALARAGETYFIHRLDRNTAGVMIFARTRAAETALRACFAGRRAEKIYLARVFGVPAPPAAVREAYLEKDEKRAVVRVSPDRGEKIVTAYQTLSTENGISLLRVTLHTGKTHQIRAHLAYLGYPVVGDEKYGDSAKNRAVHAARQQLIAHALRLFPEGELAYLGEKVFLSRKNFPENA